MVAGFRERCVTSYGSLFFSVPHVPPLPPPPPVPSCLFLSSLWYAPASRNTHTFNHNIRNTQLSMARLVEKLMAFMLLRVKEAMIEPAHTDSFVLNDLALLLGQSGSGSDPGEGGADGDPVSSHSGGMMLITR